VPSSLRLRDARLEAGLERDGYAVIDAFLDARGVAALAAACSRLEAPIHQQPFGASIMSDDLAFRAAVDRAIRDVLEPRIEAIANGYRYCFANFLVKTPRPASAGPGVGEVPIHQDISMIDESRFEALALWCPVVDTDATNGCLAVIPGSHRFNDGPRGPRTSFPYRNLDPYFRPRDVPMKAGSAIVYSPKLFHGSRPNRGHVARVAAGALLAPRGAPLRCYFPDQALQRMEVFEVDDLFYTRYAYRSRPESVPCIGVVDYWYAPLTREQLAR
jgi:ectoine hydroxylase-related dioxygenase (phytanoyl-CoA dioxygenase family)